MNTQHPLRGLRWVFALQSQDAEFSSLQIEGKCDAVPTITAHRLRCRAPDDSAGFEPSSRHNEGQAIKVAFTHHVYGIPIFKSELKSSSSFFERAEPLKRVKICSGLSDDRNPSSHRADPDFRTDS